MMNQPRRRGRPRRAPTMTVYYKNDHEDEQDNKIQTKLHSACNDTMLSPPIHFWPATLRSEYAYMRHAVILPRRLRSNGLRSCMLVWYSVEFLDGRPVTEISRELELRTFDGGPVQGPVAVCTFSLDLRTARERVGADSARVFGSGEWVHLPNLNKCVKTLTRRRRGGTGEV